MKNTSVTVGAVCEILQKKKKQRFFCLFATTCSQETQDQETTLAKIEGRFVEMEERLRKITLEIETLQHENEALKQRSVGAGEDAAPSHNEWGEAKLQSTGRPPFG